MRFAYNPAWSAPIACCFPVDRREYDWPQGLHPFFEHLAPEGWLRERQARTAHLALEDDFGLLLRFGQDCIGAVGIRSAEPLEDLRPVAEAPATIGHTISGVQRKLLVVRQGDLFQPADVAGPAPYIAKFNSPTLDTLVRNEALSLRWITKVLQGDDVTAFRLGRVADENALIVTRFDRDERNGKRRLEDFAQILCRPRGTDYAGKYNASYEEVAEVIEAHSVRPAIDLDRFFRRLIVFGLIGNCDAHLKNFSLLERPEGLRLAPIYDVVNTAVYADYDRNLALAIDGRRVALEALTQPLLRDFGRRIRLPARAVDQAFAQVSIGVRRARSVLAPPAGEPPNGFVNRYAEIVEEACLRILGA
jgi:serine/threonine-protein kinase HipA